MDWKAAAIVFGSVFVAELGDKTQLATLLFASDGNTGRWTVFVFASLALVSSVAIAVAGGELLSRYMSPNVLRYVAGTGFVAIGVWTLLSTN